MNYIGIDLGTTNSVACTVKNGRFEYIRFGRDDILPSAILYSDGNITVGRAAKRRSVVHADKYIASAKTWMGDNDHLWAIDSRIFTPTDVATEVLKEIYKAAKNHFGNNEEIQAVITVPAYFRAAQIRETELAGINAGFSVKQILPEPVAAAVAYAFEESGREEKIYVVDLGGGTFDVSLLSTDGMNTFNTLMKNGDAKLGGDDFDAAVVEIMCRHIRKDKGINLAAQEKSGFDIQEYNRIMQQLYTEAEKIKCSLSEADSENVNIVNLFTYRDTQYDLCMDITRDDFMQEAAELRNRFEKVIKESFAEIDYEPEDVDKIILVGGSANMNFVKEFVEDFFHKKPYSDMDLSKLVAMGAALKADVESDTITLHDIISHSLGVEVYGNKMAILLSKNSEYPCSITKGGFTTTRDNQDCVDINVYEGESPVADENVFYGGFRLENIQLAKANVPEIEITFAYDESNILHVTAVDKATGSSHSKDIKICPTSVKKKVEQPKQECFDVVLLLDASGSMCSSLGLAKNACCQLASQMIDMSVHSVGFASFESYISREHGLTHNEANIIDAVNSVRCGGSTDMTSAFKVADNMLSDSKNKRLVIIVTDGYPDYPDSASRAADKLKRQGMLIAAIAAGSVNHSYLSSLATSAEYYYPINDMSGLAGAFKSIAAGLKLR